MEAFSLLKYWRGGGGGGGGAAAAVPATRATTTTIATSVLRSTSETDGESADDDEGPFFDLEFAVPDEDGDGEGEGNEEGDGHGSRGGAGNEEGRDEMDGDDDEEREYNFTVSSDGSCGGGGGGQTDPNLSLSPSDDLFFKGRLVSFVEPASFVFTSSEPNSKPQSLPVSLLKSATKFRVLMLKFKKPKSAATATTAPAPAPADTNIPAPAAALSPKQQLQNKLFTVKFKVEEVPIVSLFTRDNSARSSGSNSGRMPKQCPEDANTTAEEKKFKKEIVQKYLGKIKPLYDKASKRYGEKPRLSGQLNSEPVVAKSVNKEGESENAELETAPAAVTGTGTSVKIPHLKPPGSNLPAGLRVVCKHLGKSRSASSAVAAASSPPTVLPRRRDDSLLQQQDGIQSAIAHCKRSFNASADEDDDSESLVRCKSDTTDDRSAGLAETAKAACV